MFDPQASLQAWVRVDPVPVFNFPWHTVETTLSELNTTGTAGRSYTKAGAVTAPTVRAFRLIFPTLGCWLNTDSTLDLEREPKLNFPLMERFYRVHRMAEPFLYNHPSYGLVKVRFQEPITLPRGLPGGNGYLSGVEVKLIEVPTRASLQGNRAPGELDSPSFQGKRVFDFPAHQLEIQYNPEGLNIPLGGGYQLTVKPAKPEARMLTLSFATMLRRLTASGKLDWQTTPGLNLHRLEYFYSLHRNTEPFWYEHPLCGRVKVRFEGEFVQPQGIPRGNGWTEAVTVRLREVL